MSAAPGWYPDPSGRAPLRWWDGSRWSDWESDGAGVRTGAASPPPRRFGAADLPALRFVTDVFLPEARRRRVVTDAGLAPLEQLAAALTAEASASDLVAVTPTVAPAPTVPPGPAAAPAAPPAAAAWTAPATPTPVPPTAAPAPAPAPGVGAPIPPAPAGPGPVGRWWARTRDRLDLDVTVHGLAYLGVLLLFVGVFGLVAFAFGDVAPALRPVAELAVAAVPFVAARVLARSGARFVARTMVAVGGLLLALMAVTSTVDGYPFPPELRGPALAVGASLACVVLAAVYVAWCRRRPGSALGAVVAPVLWLGAGMAAVGLARPWPSGEDVAVPGAAQTAVIALAVLATTLVARTRARAARARADRAPADRPAPDPLTDAALAAALPGAVVVGVLALVAGASEGWPVLPFLVTSAALAGAIAATPRVGRPATAVTLTAAWLLVLLRVLTVGHATPLVSASLPSPGRVQELLPVLLLAVVAGGIGVAELIARRLAGRGGPAGVAVAYALVVGALPLGVLVAVPSDPSWWPAVAAVLLTGWVVWRRTVPPALTGARPLLDTVAVVAPLLVVLGVGAAAGSPWALLAGAVLVLAVVPPARGGVLTRGADDVLWRWWWRAAATVTAAASLLAGFTVLADDHVDGRWAVPLSAVVLAGALAVGPMRPVTRVVTATPLLWWTWLSFLTMARPDEVLLSLGYAVAGLVVVVVVHAVPGRLGSVPGSVGLAGHATGALAVLVALTTPGTGTTAGADLLLGRGPTVALALATATLAGALTAVAADRGRSPVGRTLDRADAPGRLAPWSAVLVGLPLTAHAVLHATEVLFVGAPWTSAVLTAAAVAYAAATRVVRSERLAVVLPWAALGAGLSAVAVAHAASRLDAVFLGRAWQVWPDVAALAAVGLVAVLVRRPHPVLVWVAWVVPVPVVGLVGWGVGSERLDVEPGAVAAGAAVVVGGLLAVAALVADRARPSDPRVLPRRRGALAPAVVGAAQLAVGLVLVVLAVTDRLVAGTLLLAGAVALGAVAALGGVGVVGALAVLLVWVAGEPLLGSQHPGAWGHVAVLTVVLAVAWWVSRLAPPTARWARWDVPLACAAALPAPAALASSHDAERPLVWAVVGLLVVAAAVRLRRRRVLSEVLGWVGTFLVLVGAADGGPVWTAVALGLVAGAHTAIAAVWEQGAVRTRRQWVGAVFGGASWAATTVATGWSAQAATEITAVGGAVVVLVLVAVVRAGRLGSSWLVPWGAVGTVVAVLGAVRVWPDAAAVARGWLPWWGPSESTAVLVATADPTASLWHVAAWLVLAAAGVSVADGVAARAWTWGRDAAAVALLAAVLTAFTPLAVGVVGQVTALVALSAVASAGLVLAARRGGDAEVWRRPLTVLGIGAVAAVGLVLVGGTLGPVRLAEELGATGVRRLVAGGVAAAAVLAGATGVAYRALGLRLAAPVLAWVGWVLYAAEVFGAPVWFTLPVGLALLAVVAVWRADRRDRGLPPAEGAVVVLELAGIAFLVVASFVAAVTVSVLHALVAVGIGVLVALWGVATRVRRRLLAGAGIVLAGVVVAVVVPLTALLPAWGEVGTWVLVAVLGLGVVLAATFLERGREAVRGGRVRLREHTAGWE